MKLVGCLLLISGFVLAVAALVLLTTLGQRFAFVGAGLGVEALGVTLLTQGYKPTQKERR